MIDGDSILKSHAIKRNEIDKWVLTGKGYGIKRLWLNAGSS